MEIKDKGIEEFLRHQEEKHCCTKCGGVISVHDKKSYDCMVTENHLDNGNTHIIGPDISKK